MIPPDQAQSRPTLDHSKATTGSVFDDILGRQTGNDRIAISGPEPVTYARLLRRAAMIAQGLRQSGARERALIALCLPHGEEYCASLLAVAQIGAVGVMIDPLATAAERSSLLDDAQASFLIAPLADPGLQQNPEFRRTAEDGNVGVFVTRRVMTEGLPDDCLIIYTSGTTGKAKGVVLGRGALSSNIKAVADYLALCPGDHGLVFTPPALAFAVNQILSHLWAGATVRLWGHGLMFANRLLTELDSSRITGVACNPTSARILLKSRRPPGFQGDTVRYFMSGGQPLLLEDVAAIRDAFPNSRVVNMYGCSENCPRVAFHWIPLHVSNDRPAFPVGQPVRGTRIRIISPAGTPVPPGESGEILVGGDSLASRYWNNEELTRERFVDGWFHTRDLGQVDADGNLHLVGRLDTILNVGHYKVSPEEIETVLGGVEGVLEAGVTGRSDPLLGTVPVALLVGDGDAATILRNARAACAEALSRHKIPQKFLCVETLPRTPYGKIDRPRLQALADSHAETHSVTL
jgi:acyl-CoA synthetase (AMP-forming)/AMP-acid ligase II